MRILVFSTLYPNAAMPLHGVFVENRLRAFLKKYDADVKVIAPAPWFPFQNETFGAYGAWARVPEREFRHGIEILHPRYVVPPKTAMHFSPDALAKTLKRAIESLADRGWNFDLIDAHYFFPDGVAAVKVAQAIEKPVVVTARGTDVNFIPKFRGPRKKIVNAANKADALITVSDGLKRHLSELGIASDRITVLRNGIDIDQFSPKRTTHLRTKLGLSGPVLASVGQLIERKGHDIAIDALQHVPDAALLIAGEGKLRSSLERKAQQTGVAGRVHFLGAIAPEKLPEVYSIADALVLASSREGWPNVLLESMACGAPCIAADIAGNREVIRDKCAGIVVPERTPEAFGDAINAILEDPPKRAETRQYAARHSWDETVDGMNKIFQKLKNKEQPKKIFRVSADKEYNHRPKLLITVDAEEEFDWSLGSRSQWNVSDTGDINRFQKLCRKFGAAPLYFLSYPMLENPASAAYFRALAEKEAAHCGLHLHTWVTPPSIGADAPVFSFQKNLPKVLHARKLRRLADMFEMAMGYSATTHRAGRYGVSPDTYALLASIGVHYDFSPSPAFDFSKDGGPDFSDLSNIPFEMPTADGAIVVTPVSGAKALRGTSLFLKQEYNAPGFDIGTKTSTSSLKPAMRLTPEGTTLADLKGLTRRLVSDGVPVLTFTLHSTSLTVGATPYSRTENDVSALIGVTRTYLDWFKTRLNGEIISFADLEKIYTNTARRAVA